MSDRATLDEVLEFANKVREAGGGNPLDALMPATPTASTECLVAKNLNFNCRVAADLDEDEAWFMEVESESLAKQIGQELGLNFYKSSATWHGVGEWRITLPEEIARVAEDFDKAWYLAEALQAAYNYFEQEDLDAAGTTGYDTWQEYFEYDRLEDLALDLGYRSGLPKTLSESLSLIHEMWPYVIQSRYETQQIGIFNEQGELIL